jgi:hypothetical protein
VQLLVELVLLEPDIQVVLFALQVIQGALWCAVLCCAMLSPQTAGM